jgi:hypothetical protein
MVITNKQLLITVSISETIENFPAKKYIENNRQEIITKPTKRNNG